MANNPNIVTALDQLLIKPIQNAGTPVQPRTNLNLIGCTYADNPTNDSSDFTATGGGSGIVSGDTTVVAGVATTVGLRTIPIAATAPFATQALVAQAGGAGYLPQSVELVLNVDEFIDAASGVVFTGVQNALNQIATLSRAAFGNLNPGALVLQFGPKIYVNSTSATWTLLNAYGCIIRGSGHGMTRIYTSGGGQRAVLQQVNCSYVSTEHIQFLNNGDNITTLTGTSTAGTTTLHVPTGTPVVNGQLFTVINAVNQGEVLQCVSGGGTTALTVVSVSAATSGSSLPLRNTYASGDRLYTNAVYGLEFYVDQAQMGNTGTQNVASDCSSFGPMIGFATNCAGFSGSSSDVDNDQHAFVRCRQLSGIGGLVGLHIGHANSLAIEIPGCNWSACYGVEMLTGGSFNANGGAWAISGYGITLGGTFNHLSNVYGTVMGDNVAGVIQARASDGAITPRINMWGFDTNNGHSGADNLQFDVTCSFGLFLFKGCNFSAGVAGTVWLMNFKDAAGATLKTTAVYEDCSLGAYGGTADGVRMVRIRSQWTAHGDLALHETVANGGVWTGDQSGMAGNGQAPANQFELYGARYGEIQLRNTTGPVTGTYGLDSSGYYDDVILFDASSANVTLDLDIVFRFNAGRAVVLICVATGHSLIIDPQASSPINGGTAGATVTLTPSTVGQRYTLNGDKSTNTKWWVG